MKNIFIKYMVFLKSTITDVGVEEMENTDEPFNFYCTYKYDVDRIILEMIKVLSLFVNSLDDSIDYTEFKRLLLCLIEEIYGGMDEFSEVEFKEI